MNNEINDIEDELEAELVLPKYILLLDDFEVVAHLIEMPTMNIEIKMKEVQKDKMKITDLKSKNIKPIHNNW